MNTPRQLDEEFTNRMNVASESIMESSMQEVQDMGSVSTIEGVSHYIYEQVNQKTGEKVRYELPTSKFCKSL